MGTMLADLFLANPSLRLDSFDTAEQCVTITVVSTRTEAKCPDCGCAAQRVHSQYIRNLADLPLAGQRVQIRLQVRRFFCDRPSCQRKTFSERLPDFAPKSARRTKRLADVQTVVGLAVGGEAGARLVHRLEMPASPDTLLRLIRRQPIQDTVTPRVLGIDDWAWKKGRAYGTILVDMERRCPVDLLPDRTADTLAVWLKDHPGVEIVGRDRAGAYADGVTRGAPNAIQVADRWHLLTNMRETVQRLLDRHHHHLPALSVPQATAMQNETPCPPTTISSEKTAVADEADVQSHLTTAERIRQERRSRRLDRFSEIVALHQAGVSIRAISTQLGVCRHTVRRYIAADSFPEIAKRRPRPSILDPWKPYLRQRWDEGCHNGRRLWREIKAQGYRGSRTLLSAWVADLRKTVVPLTPFTATKGPDHHPPIMTAERQRQLSAKQAAWLVVKQPSALTIEEQEALAEMRQASPDIEHICVLAQAFGQLVREREYQEFDHWVEAAKGTGIRELKSFTAGLLRDKAAVMAALSLPWSNDQVEGQVNRLKLIKRQMYGRANFDLLRQRVLDPG